MFTRRIRAGDWVEIRPARDIIATVDERGCVDGLPFMPEMLRYCGQRFRVQSVAHKTCDTVNKTGGRRMRSAYHLEGLRCDGAAHGGCQAACLFFWKEVWLRPVAGPSAPANPSSQQSPSFDDGVIQRNVSISGEPADRPRYVCQATLLYKATQRLAWWDLRQYWADVRTRNFPLRHVLSTLLLASLYRLRKLPVGFRVSRWIYEQAHRWLRGCPAPHFDGRVPEGQKTPEGRLDLLKGEWVRVKSREEIRDTLNTDNRNRGLRFDVEMSGYCGQRHRVESRVSRIINEQTGEMMHFQNPCIVLADVYCKGEYSDRRLLCPRRITSYWRELWLERVDGAPKNAPDG